MSKLRKTPTEKRYSNWKGARIALRTTKYVSPFIPATTLTIINAEEWFAEKPFSISVGFASLLVSILISMATIMKKDNLLKNKVDPLFILATILACFGVSFMFLGSISTEFGKMFLFTALGVVSSGVSGQIDSTLVQDKLKWYDDILKEAGLDRKANKKALERQRAIAQAKAEAEDIGGFLE